MYRIRENVKNYLQQNYIIFFLLIIIFILGIFFGALSLKTLNSSQKSELSFYLKSFFQGFSQKDVNNLALVRISLFNNLKTIGLIWVLGLTVIGAPLILLIMFTRGFIFGFTVGFLIERYSYKGLFFTLLAILPHNLLIFPVLFFISMTSLNLAKDLIRQRFGRFPIRISNLLAQNIIALACSGIILMVAGFIEAYIPPFFIGLLSGMLR